MAWHVCARVCVRVCVCDLSPLWFCIENAKVWRMKVSGNGTGRYERSRELNNKQCKHIDMIKLQLR